MGNDDEDWNCVSTKSNKKVKLKEKKQTQNKNVVENLLQNYKIRLCWKSVREHDLRTCIYAHGQKELRRNPYKEGTNDLRYSKDLCFSMKDKGSCKDLEDCVYSHNDAEQHFHPAIYRTVQCKRQPNCHIHFCYFAHGPNELRTPKRKDFEITKNRSVRFNEFVNIPKPELNASKLKDTHCIEVIRNWSGWQEMLVSREIHPCPLDDVFSRMMFKYKELQDKVREICFKEGCTPYMEIGQRSSSCPVLLMINGPSRDAICASIIDIQEFFAKARPKTEEKFPVRFLTFLESTSKGEGMLKALCIENKGIDISVERYIGVVIVWGCNQNKRNGILLELKKICTEFALKDAQNIANARLQSLETELLKTQRQLQEALEENFELKESLKNQQQNQQQQHVLQEKRMILQRQKVLPEYWESSDGYQEFNVEKDSEEWEKVETHFLATINVGHRHRTNIYKIVNIRRVENHDLWNHYALLRKNILIEKDLWHGTSMESLVPICKKGFDRSYAGMNATKFGKGTYFARDSLYSTQYAGRDINYCRYMVMSKVLVGRYMQGDSKLNYLANGFDSAVNNTMNPSIYVTFKDYQAYPAYIVKFKKDGE